jgi:hypothetical protein
MHSYSSYCNSLIAHCYSFRWVSTFIPTELPVRTLLASYTYGLRYCNSVEVERGRQRVILRFSRATRGIEEYENAIIPTIFPLIFVVGFSLCGINTHGKMQDPFSIRFHALDTISRD